MKRANTVALTSLILITATLFFAKNQLNKVQVSNELELEVSKAFSDWTIEHGKLYTSEDHHNLRFQIFKENYVMIKASNEQNKSYTLGLNKWADLSHEEFSDKFGLLTLEEMQKEHSEVQMLQNQQEFEVKQTPQPPKSLNWQTQVRAGTLRDIGDCTGAGHLLSAIVVQEAAVAIFRNNLVTKLSAQYVMDCMDKTTGCQGSEMKYYLSHLYKKGTVKDWDYKWQGKLQQCQSRVFGNIGQQPAPTTTKITNYKSYSSNKDTLYPNLIFQGPFLAALSVSPQMRFYSSGIFTPNTTDNQCPTFNRYVYVSADGYTMDNDGNGNYILKFPWGAFWGSHGTMRFIKQGKANQYTKNTCGFYGFAYSVEYKE